MTQATPRTGNDSESSGKENSRTAAWIGGTLRQAGWAPLLVFLVYLVTAFVLDLFDVLPRLDLAMHFAGGLATAFFISRALAVHQQLWPSRQLSSRREAALVLVLTLAVALLWELAEFTSDRLFGTQEQLGSADTLRDLLAGFLGAIVYLALPGVFARLPN
jgi:uncharacterized membrane protein YjdF